MHDHNDYASDTSELHDTPVDQEAGLMRAGTTRETTGPRSAAFTAICPPGLPYSMVLHVHVNPQTL